MVMTYVLEFVVVPFATVTVTLVFVPGARPERGHLERVQRGPGAVLQRQRRHHRRRADDPAR
jgi:hypothetical protein